MPIPKPNPAETADKFIQRCMSDEIMLNEYPDQKDKKEKMQLKNCDNTVNNAESTKP